MMPVAYIICFAIIIQTVAAIIAFRLVFVTGRKVAWILLSLALSLMAMRRMIPLYHLVFGTVLAPPDLLFESLGLALSLAMAVGIAMIAPLFQERLKTEKSLREGQQRLERHVNDRTLALKRRSEELQRAIERLKEADRTRSVFLAAMSHELRTPLNSIIGYSSIMHAEWMGPVNDEQKESLATVVHAGKHLLSMISDVLDATQLEAGAAAPVVEEFDLYDVLSDARNELLSAIRDKNLELRSELLHQRMRSEPRRLLQCVENLLENAVRFTDHGSVTLAARIVPNRGTTAEKVEITVEDTGIGIRPNDQAKIFQPFARIITPQRRIVPGTGLGLYLTRKVAREILKGDIVLVSKLGKGSRFTLRIPTVLPEITYRAAA